VRLHNPGSFPLSEQASSPGIRRWQQGMANALSIRWETLAYAHEKVADLLVNVFADSEDLRNYCVRTHFVFCSSTWKCYFVFRPAFCAV
jgi:hypothetical protein